MESASHSKPEEFHGSDDLPGQDTPAKPCKLPPSIGSHPAVLNPECAVVYASIRVNIEQATGTVLHTHVHNVRLPAAPTLQSVRDALLASKLASDEYDLFFPKWTYTMYVTRADDGDVSVHSVETDGQLQALLDDERAVPGTLAIKLEQCKNAKYSRFRQADARSSTASQIGSCVSGSSQEGAPCASWKPRGWKRKFGSHSSPARCQNGPVVATATTPLSPRGSPESKIGAAGSGKHRLGPPIPIIDLRDQFGSAAATAYQSYGMHPADMQAVGTGNYGMQSVFPMHPMYYLHPMGYWAYAHMPPSPHNGTTYYYDSPAPWVTYGANYAHCY
jgi:hypothetical protein